MRIFKPLQSYLLVTLIAALIWLYAEGQDVRTLSRDVVVSLPARIGQNMVADFADGSDQMKVAVTFKGATAPLGQLQAHLGALGTVQLPIQGSVNTVGKQTLDLSALMSRVQVDPEQAGSPTVGESGISVVSVEPAQEPIIVDQLAQQQVRVLFSPEGVQLGPNVTIEPSSIPVTLPRSYVEQLQGRPDALYAEAMISPNQLSNMPESVEQRLQLNLQLSKPLDPDRRILRHIKLGVGTAYVTFTIVRQQDSLAVQLVPVWLTSPPSELRRYDVTLTDESRVLREVMITGPRDLIEQMRTKPKEIRVIACFQLTGDMLDRGVTSAPISSVQIQQVLPTGQSRVLHDVPVNPAAMVAGSTEVPPSTNPAHTPSVPTFLSPSISIVAPTATVHFTVTKREQPSAAVP